MSLVHPRRITRVQQKNKESINDYFSRFKQTNAKYLTVIPEYELVQMAAVDFDYGVWKNMIN